ncbi:MAG TPA: aminoglycoside 6'-N-acetyltransferase [Arsenophonus nasoniae]|uniref:aminoglycoside 6'-N-acetyltransferase n=1 Tax=Arsenophonus nasoniae TaxID=638 RepID=UPI00387A775D
MSIIIRKMEKTDRMVWATMRLQLWDKQARASHLNDIDNILSNKQNAAYIALLANHQAVGFAEISLREYANGCSKQPVPFLEGIWVKPEYRQQGIAQALISQITTDLIAKGFDELCSDAEIGNTLSHKAHQNWGFDEIERVICFRKKLI